jgi:hypothetical protein
MKKEVKLINLSGELFLIEVNNSDIITHVVNNEQIGLINETLQHETMNEYWVTNRHVEITQSHIDRILKNDGICYIEMETYEGDYCGYREPKLIDGKVIIHM